MKRDMNSDSGRDASMASNPPPGEPATAPAPTESGPAGPAPLRRRLGVRLRKSAVPLIIVGVAVGAVTSASLRFFP